MNAINPNSAEDLTPAKTGLITKFLRVLASVRRKVWLISFIGFGLGIICLILYDLGLVWAHSSYAGIHVEDYPFFVHATLDLLHDVAIGFFVASLAGVGFEGLYQSTGDAQKEIETQMQISSLIRAAENMEHHADHAAAIKQHLDNLLPNAKYNDFKLKICQVVKAAAKIKDGDDARHQGREATEYVSLLSWMMEHYVLDGATALGQLLKAVSPDEPVFSAKYAPPDRITLAQQILRAQMLSMKPGDRYDSVANPNLYLGGDYQKYLDATEEALTQNKVTVRRVYNVCMFEGDAAKRIAATIKEQRDRFAPSGKFQARVFQKDHAASVDRFETDALGLPNPESLHNLYFGIFQHNSGGSLVFSAEPADVSKLTLEAFSVEENVKQRSDQFELIWSRASSEVDEFIKQHAP
jgi:hypothetical protein